MLHLWWLPYWHLTFNLAKVNDKGRGACGALWPRPVLQPGPANIQRHLCQESQVAVSNTSDHLPPGISLTSSERRMEKRRKFTGISWKETQPQRGRMRCATRSATWATAATLSTWTDLPPTPHQVLTLTQSMKKVDLAGPQRWKKVVKLNKCH